MGKKKPFIDKKRATTYTLVYKAAEEDLEGATGPERDRVLVSASRPAVPVSGPPTRGPCALYAHFSSNGQADEANISEARRQELLEYGFPDDGYDYLQHCRVIGRGSASLQENAQSAETAIALRDPAAAGSSNVAEAAAAAEPQQPSLSVFLQAPRAKAPTADVVLVDAREVAVGDAAAANSSSAADSAAVITAATGTAVPTVASQAFVLAAAKQLGGRVLVAELLELEQLMAAAEEASDAEAAGDEGVGDLLDDFVMTAAAAANNSNLHSAAALSLPAAGGGAVAAQQHHFNDDEDDEFCSEVSDDGPHQSQQRQQHRLAAAALPQQHIPSAAAAAASSTGYDLLNDQFNNLLSAYDDGELGDLEGDHRATGRIGPQQLQAMVASQHHRASHQHLQASLHQAEEPACFYSEDEFSSEGNGDELTPGTSEAGGNFTAGACRGRKPTPSRAPGLEPKVESFADKDDAVIAAVRARLAAQEAAADTPGTSSSKGAAGGMLVDEEVATVYVPAEREGWDCESIMSMRSNISHFPAKIVTEGARRQHGGAASRGAAAAGTGIIKLNAKTGLPSGYGTASMAAAAAAAAAASGASQRLTVAAIAAAAAARAGDEEGFELNGDAMDGVSMNTSIFERPTRETAEERKARKAAVKAMQRDARANKKQLKQLYASEGARQQKQQTAATRATVFAIP